jgi:Peptidase M1 N-terminal domain
MKFSSGAVAALFVLTSSSLQDKSTMSLAFAASSNNVRRAVGAVVGRTVPNSMPFGITAVNAAASGSSASSSMNRNQFCTWNDNKKHSSSSLCSVTGSSRMLNKKFSPLMLLSHHRGGALYSSTTAEEQSVITEDKPIEYFRTDYVPLSYTVSNVELDFNINDGKTTVTSTLTIRKNPNISSNDFVNELVLDGDEKSVTLKSLYMNNKELVLDVDYVLQPGKLIIKSPIDNAIITSTVEIVPENNTQLSGLYKSGSSYCTQCEAMGFRRITYYPDRPDNMAIFDKVRIEASKSLYPVLLSNGNLIEEGDIADGTDRHYAIWSDPFPKPSYLFATVAGNLGKIEDTFTTMSGRTVQLVLYSEHFNVDKLHYAMDALKRSMKWDEDRFGVSSNISFPLYLCSMFLKIPFVVSIQNSVCYGFG